MQYVRIEVLVDGVAHIEAGHRLVLELAQTIPNKGRHTHIVDGIVDPRKSARWHRVLSCLNGVIRGYDQAVLQYALTARLLAGQIEIAMIAYIHGRGLICARLDPHIEAVVVVHGEVQQHSQLARIALVALGGLMAEGNPVRTHHVQIPNDAIESNEAAIDLMLIIQIARDTHLAPVHYELPVRHAVRHSSQHTAKASLPVRLVAGHIVEAEHHVLHVVVGIRALDALYGRAQLDDLHGQMIRIANRVASHHLSLVRKRIDGDAKDILRHFYHIAKFR